MCPWPIIYLINLTIVGCIRVFYDGYRTMTHLLSVHSYYQNRGIGGNLVTKAIKILKGRGAPTVSVVIGDFKDGLGHRFTLVPGGDFDRFYEELTNDDTRVRVERRLSDKSDRLAKECRDTYKAYRAKVRDILYL